MSKYIQEYKEKLGEFLSKQSLDDLRRYGRELGVYAPTKLMKSDIIPKILAITSGEAAPIERSKRGAPVKNNSVNPDIPAEVQRLQLLYLDISTTEKPQAGKNDEPDYTITDEEAYMNWKLFQQRPKAETLTLHSPDFDKIEVCNGQRMVYRGQLQTLNNVSLLLPLTGVDETKKILVPIELIHNHGLQEGDIVSCYGEKQERVVVATKILTVNEILLEDFRRKRFEESEARYPSERIRFYDGKNFSMTELKYLDWLIPFGKGQRCCVFGAPKSGKTTLLLKTIRAARELNDDVTVMSLLMDQTPETVSLFQKEIDRDMLIYTTDEDEVERQIFLAEFLLRRAKSYAESGRDVLLIVDSISALATVFNETNDSLGGKTLACGLETKTIHYIKKFLGSARCLDKGGSLAILGAVDIDTGNPSDDVLSKELSARANLSIYLKDELAVRRVYPAIDFQRSQVQQREALQTQKEIAFDFLLRNEYLAKYQDADLIKLLDRSKSYQEFVENVKNAL